MAAHARSMDRARARQYIVPADLRRRIERAVERLITTLDSFDIPDADLEDNKDAEAFADDEEPSLGATNMVDQNAAWQNTFSDTDIELDEGESGIADADGLVEQTVGEPSLGATVDIDQRVSWAEPAFGVTDGEAQGTSDDLGRSGVSGQDWLAREARQAKTRADLQAFLERRQSSTTGERAAL